MVFWANSPGVPHLNQSKNKNSQITSVYIFLCKNSINFVISGKFLKFSRESLQNEIKINGGKVSKSLSSQTTFLLAGENMGPKKKIKAQNLKIKIISEDDFISMI